MAPNLGCVNYLQRPATCATQATLTIECFNDRRVQLYDCEPLRRDLHKLRVEEKSYGVRLTSPRDGEGHGDTFSAFALALLLAHELAGNAPVVLRPLFGAGNNSAPIDWWQLRLAEYKREEQRLQEPDDDQEEWKQLMRLSGAVRKSLTP